ncbi:protein TPX2-like isoform X5 [Canna indica]|uniref:Protein TPX2-like isoform X5 n=1 Tax=Canna indica TaxID=4628 RepID=A0AAQ3KUZ0_9LILI|nr:protein TPX2-like isoform X5 [Canna indica]
MVDGGGDVGVLQIDEMYEFSAPRFYDFINEETQEEIERAELWFETSLSYAPSPFMPKIRERRSVQIESLCDFGNADQDEKMEVPAQVNQPDSVAEAEDTTRSYQQEFATDVEVKAKQCQGIEDRNTSAEFVSEVKPCQTNTLPQQEIREKVPSFEFPVAILGGAPVAASATCTTKAQRSPKGMLAPNTIKNQVTVETCTPRPQRIAEKGAAVSSSKKSTAIRNANLTHQPSARKLKTNSSAVQSSKSIKSKNVTKCPGSLAAKNSLSTLIAQENQAVKKQKLENGRSRQIHNVKNRVLIHKSGLGLSHGPDIFSSVTPFTSAAEIINKFQSGTRDLDLFQNISLSHDNAASVVQSRPKLSLTRPKDPELETAHRVRAVRIKSSAELEEEMLAKIPKFKARPLNKKIFEAPTLPAVPRSVPQAPVFEEFHLKTMERANLYAETSSAISTADSSHQVKTLKLTEPRPPHLETSLRARPPKVKSTQERELEELEKIEKFKARPLNKKILESKGDLGLFCNSKPQITIPEEFHFSTNDRLGPPVAVVEQFDKLSLYSESSNHERKEVPRITIPNPFHLHTEDRGLEKERQFAEQVLLKELEADRARIPKAKPYPYTTDFPVMPPKPEPKQCTKPEAFQLESLVRHEEEMQRMLEERERAEREEAQRRIFRAQPILKVDPLPFPEKERKPLTEVQKFVLHVDHRALQRTEFDSKIKEKELIYKRLREEQEFAKMIEEEKAVKQMRRTMVPHARPLPKFSNPFAPQKSDKEVTKAKSPDLRVNHRVERRQQLYMR